MPTIIDAFIMTMGIDGKGVLEGGQKVREEFKRTRADAEDQAKRIEEAGKRAGEFFSNMRKQALEFFATMAGGAGLTQFLANTIKTEAGLGDLSKQLNTSAKDIYAIEKAVQDFGGTSADADSALRNLQQTFSNAEMGINDPHLDALRRLGVTSIADMADRRRELMIISQGLQRFDPDMQQAIGQRAGLSPAMITMLAQGPAAVGKLLGDKGGMAPTDDQIERAKVMRGLLNDLSQRFAHVGDILLEKVGPALIKVMGWLDDLVENHMPLVVGAFEALGAAVAVSMAAILGPVAMTVGGVTLLIAGLIDDFETFKKTGESAFDWAEIARQFNAALATATEWLNALLRAIWPLVQVVAQFFAGLAAGAAAVLPGFIAALGNLWESLIPLIGLLSRIAAVFIQAFGPTIVALLTTIGRVVTDAINIIAGVINLVVGLLTGDWARAWRGAKDIAMGVLKAIADSVSGLTNAIALLWDGLNPLGKHLPSGTAPQLGTPQVGIPGRGTPGASAAPSAAAAAAAGGVGDKFGRVAAFFKSHGFSDAQAKGIAAGVYAESGLNENARNPTSGAMGLGQWLSKDRVARLKQRYGDKPTFQQQLEFLLWEMRNTHGKAGTAINRAGSAEDALSIYIRRVMAPAPGAETAGDMQRGLSALAANGNLAPSSAAASTALGSRARYANAGGGGANPAGGHVSRTDVHIDKIEIHTQAKDAAGIAKEIGPAVRQRAFVPQANTGLS